MRIMFMAQCYAPEDVSAAVLITELATDLVRRGHQVAFITGAPNYPQGRVFAGYSESGLPGRMAGWGAGGPDVELYLPEQKLLAAPAALWHLQRVRFLRRAICRQTGRHRELLAAPAPWDCRPGC